MKWLSSCAYVPVAEDGGLEDASSREGSEDEGDENEEEEEEEEEEDDSETDMLSGDGTDEEDGNAEGSRTYFVPIGMASPTFFCSPGKECHTCIYHAYLCSGGSENAKKSEAGKSAQQASGSARGACAPA